MWVYICAKSNNIRGSVAGTCLCVYVWSYVSYYNTQYVLVNTVSQSIVNFINAFHSKDELPLNGTYYPAEKVIAEK